MFELLEQSLADLLSQSEQIVVVMSSTFSGIYLVNQDLQ